MHLLCSFYVLVILFAVDAAHSHKGLSCVNDFVNNVSCTWTRSPLAPGVDCSISGVKRIWITRNRERVPDQMIRTCKVQQLRNHPPGCNFVFENERFNRLKDMPYISMECNGTLMENITNYKPYDHIKMHPPGVPNVSSKANETWISWRPGFPRSVYIPHTDFQVNITQENQTWKESFSLSTQELKIRIPAWRLKGFCQVRVRVKPNKIHRPWSDWSPTTSWMAATDVVETSQDQELFLDWTSLIMLGVMFSLGLVLVVMLVVCRSCVRKGLHEGKPVPNPSKYFHTLHSVHGGNLKKWLNPLSASESFFTAHPCDHISPVELCRSWDVVLSTSPSSCSTTVPMLYFNGCPSVGSDTSGVADNSSSSSSSWFSNRGYFMSSSSGGSARTDPNPVYFTYKDDVHNFHLSMSPSPMYEGLKREPLSPDSGFGIGGEEEEYEGDNLEAEEVSDDHHNSPLLIFPLHLTPRMCPPSSPPPHANAPNPTQVSSDSRPVDAATSTASGSYTAWPTAGAMCRSSSMPVEPCKTGYLTLKELQTTFSNNSI